MNIIAALGPTNTGKTHYAIERLTSYRSGMIGLPLRLLTKEVYDKVVKIVGPSRVALVTGEEKILPINPQYWVCTVESMPTSIPCEFVAIDEIQLINDSERGYIFTDRLLNLRGMSETLFLGSQTSEKIIKKLLNKIRFHQQPRFSKLSYSGYKKLSHLPRRSAIVAFSAQSVYAIAELIRRQKGGVAIVMGSLSPRTRNAQVDMYQKGEVDFLVATDAIGMGLNLDLNHVAFAETRKYDGRQFRKLEPYELAQIAGRAGRYQKDGTFGVTGDEVELDNQTIIKIEDHNFENINYAHWRNKNLNFSSVNDLIESLKKPSTRYELKNSPDSEDLKTLIKIYENKSLEKLLKNKDTLKLLWETCQIPDFRQIGHGIHVNIIETIFLELFENEQLSDEWLQKNIQGYSVLESDDIYSLSNKLSHIRTWSFIVNKERWLSNSLHWQRKSREIEDNLSDALHYALTERFVDKSTINLRLKFQDNKELLTGLNNNGDVTVEGNYFGKIEGLRFIPQFDKSEAFMKKIYNSINKIVEKEITKKISYILSSDLSEFSLENSFNIYWRSQFIGYLKKGDDVLLPKIQLICDEIVKNTQRQNVENKIQEWLINYLNHQLTDLYKLKNADELKGNTKGFAYRISEELGTLDRRSVEKDLKILDTKSRQALKKYGIKIGKYSIYVSSALKPGYGKLLAPLWLIYNSKNLTILSMQEQINSLPKPGITSSKIDKKVTKKLYKYAGYKILGNYVVRTDILERLDKLIFDNIKLNNQKGEFVVNNAMISLLGSSLTRLEAILKTLGYSKKKNEKSNLWLRKIKKQKKITFKNKNKKNLSKKDGNKFFNKDDLIKLKERLMFEQK